MIRIKNMLTLRPWQRHSLVLMVSGLAYIVVGLSFVLSDELSLHRAQSLVIALRMATIDLWGLVFISSGFLACISSRWPLFSDSWGYAVLCGLSAGWSTVHAAGIIFGNANLSTNAPGILIWGLMAFLWWAVSGLINPPEKIVEVIDESS